MEELYKDTPTAVPVHWHNGLDSNTLDLNSIMPNAPQPAISGPSGGATVDSQARNAINDIITKLKNVGITL
jgi:hypothetical protein